jgi:hypothetical protein
MGSQNATTVCVSSVTQPAVTLSCVSINVEPLRMQQGIGLDDDVALQ